MKEENGRDGRRDMMREKGRDGRRDMMRENRREGGEIESWRAKEKSMTREREKMKEDTICRLCVCP